MRSNVRRSVRHGLYMALLVAARHNPILRAFYLRLRAAGKPAKLALTATMRKLLIVLNSSQTGSNLCLKSRQLLTATWRMFTFQMARSLPVRERFALGSGSSPLSR